MKNHSLKNMLQVAQHLANTYGDQAFSVAKQASLTGKKWPILGRRLHEQFPYIEAEVNFLFILYIRIFRFKIEFTNHNLEKIVIMLHNKYGCDLDSHPYWINLRYFVLL